MATSAHSALLGERMARSGLAARTGDLVAATAAVTAVQAQDPAAARLGVRARSGSTVDESAVVAAIDSERSLVRTWLMRGTIHLVAAADLRWLVALLGPAVQRKFATRWRQLGLTSDVQNRCLELLPKVLADGPRTRTEIRDELAERGLTLQGADRQLHTHALVHASIAGLVCRGPDRGREATFVLLDDWLPEAPAGPRGDDALAELARRYFAAYSPATAADFTTWAGLPSSRAIALIADELERVDVAGRPGFRRGHVAPAGGVRLLPAFDNYVLAHRDRSALVAPQWHGHVYQGGLIHPTVVVDGRVVGRWRLDRARGRVELTPFEEWSPTIRRAVADEITDVGRFLGRNLDRE